MRVALIHEWLVTCAGSERAFAEIVRLFPEADLFSLIDKLPPGGRGLILDKPVRTSFLQHMPLVREKYRLYLPLMPLAVERFDLSAYDLVISSSHAVVKGVRTRPGQTHLCYCYTPIRYAWDLREQYLRESGLDHGLRGFLAGRVLDYIRRWDARAAQRPNHYAAISKYIAERIRKTYGREATVIHPPVDTEFFTPGAPGEVPRGDFYLAASRLVPYKRMDLIVSAFREMPERRLLVMGDGPDEKKVRAAAEGYGNIEFRPYGSPETLRDALRRARALVFAADEDFGITTVEAQATGTPVIAYGHGGSLETVVEGETGVFFAEQTRASIKSAIERFERIEGELRAERIAANAERFGRERFRREFSAFVSAAAK
jgi:glycosyltransferase involved in cell wall biosynthesis